MTTLRLQLMMQTNPKPARKQNSPTNENRCFSTVPLRTVRHGTVVIIRVLRVLRDLIFEGMNERKNRSERAGRLEQSNGCRPSLSLHNIRTYHYNKNTIRHTVTLTIVLSLHFFSITWQIIAA